MQDDIFLPHRIVNLFIYFSVLKMPLRRVCQFQKLSVFKTFKISVIGNALFILCSWLVFLSLV